MTLADKAAEIKSDIGKGGEKPGREEGIEEALEHLVSRRVLAELIDEDEEPGERLVHRALRRRLLSELIDEDEVPSERLMRRAIRRRMLARLFDEDEEPGERLMRRAIRRQVLAELVGEDEESGERLMRRGIGRRVLGEMFDEGEEPGERLMRRATRRRLLARLLGGRPIERRMRLRQFMRAAFAPKADVFEQDGTLVIKTELPGLKKGDVEITVDDGDLVISGERKGEPTVKDEDYYQGETAHGKFYRRFELPSWAKLDQIKAEHKDGVLEIRVPMPPRTKVPVA